MDDSTRSDPHQRHACEEMAIRLTNPQNLLTQAKQLLDLANFMKEHNITLRSLMAETCHFISVDASAPSMEDVVKRAVFNLKAVMAMETITMIKSYANKVEALELFKDHDPAEMDTVREEVLRRSRLTSEECEEIVARSMSDGKRLLQLINSHRGFLGLLPEKEWFCGKMLSSDEDDYEHEDCCHYLEEMIDTMGQTQAEEIGTHIGAMRLTPVLCAIGKQVLGVVVHDAALDAQVAALLAQVDEDLTLEKAEELLDSTTLAKCTCHADGV